MKHPKIEIIFGTIEKKGRKYYYVDGPGPKFQVLITDSIKGKKVGERLSVEALLVESPSKGKSKGITLKCYAPIDSEYVQQQTEEYHKKKVASLTAEIRQGIQKGHVDPGAVSELRDLEGSEEILAQLKKEWAERKKELDKEEIERSVEYIRKGLKEGYRCPRTLDRLAKLGRNDLVAQFEAEWEVWKAQLAPEIEKCVAYIREGIEKGYECPKTMNKLRSWGCDDLVSQLETEWEIKETTRKARHRIEQGFRASGLMEKLRSMGCTDLVAQLETEYAVKKSEREALKSLRLAAEGGEYMEEISLPDLLQGAEVLYQKSPRNDECNRLLIKNNEIFYITHQNYTYDTSTMRYDFDSETTYGYHTPLTDDLKKSLDVLRKANFSTSDPEEKVPTDHE